MEMEDFPFRTRKGVPAAFYGDYAVVGDVHVGFERRFGSEGFNVWDKTQELLDEIISLGSRKLIILGDLRDDYAEIKPDEGGILFRFMSLLSDRFGEIVITKGNHDGGLIKLTHRLRNVSLEREFVSGDVGFMHGHSMPSRHLAESVKTVCFGHLHPSLVVRDANGVPYKNDCWLLMDVALPAGKYGRRRLEHGICFPKFNKYIGSTDSIDDIGLMKYAEVTHRLTTSLMLV